MNKFIIMIITVFLFAGIMFTLSEALPKVQGIEKNMSLDYKENKDKIEFTKKCTKLMDLIIEDEENNIKEKQQYINELFTPIENIKITEKNYDKETELELYKSKKYDDVIALSDGVHFEINNPNLYTPTKYSDIIKKIEEQSDINFLGIRQGENTDLLAFSNPAGMFFVDTIQSLRIIYSTRYNDVSIYPEDTPIIYMIYMKNSNVCKIDIIIQNIKYSPVQLTDNNIDETKELLKSVGINNTDLIINTLKNKEIEKTIEIDNLKLIYKKDIADIGRYSKDILSVSVE